MKKYQQGGSTSYGQGSYYTPSYGSPYIQQAAQIQQQAGLQDLMDKMKEFESKGELDITKRKMTKEMQDKMAAAMKKAKKKIKKLGIAGNVLGFGLNFVPGLQGWGAAGVQSLVAGLQTQLQKEAMEKAAKMKFGVGTFLSSQGEDYAEQVKGMVGDYDPLKAAATSMIGSGIGMGIEKGVEAGKTAKAAKELKELEKLEGLDKLDGVDKITEIGDVPKDITGGKEVMSEEAWLKENYPHETSVDEGMLGEYGKYVKGAKETTKVPELVDPGEIQPTKELKFDSTGGEKADVYFGKAGTSAEKWGQAKAWLTDPNIKNMLQGLLGEDEEGYETLIAQLIGSFDPYGRQEYHPYGGQ